MEMASERVLVRDGVVLTANESAIRAEAQAEAVVQAGCRRSGS